MKEITEPKLVEETLDDETQEKLKKLYGELEDDG